MQITHMTYARAAQGAEPSPVTLRVINDGINNFLSDHIVKLREITRQRRTPAGKFTDQEAQRQFRGLYLGTDEAFLDAAGSLTKRLIAKMDGRTSPGLLICLRAHDDQQHYGGVLKLQVVAEHGAVLLESLESGEVELSAVTKLLDRPGELQKGALSTSWLAEDRIMVGDRLGQDAAYFPEAFGIKIFSRPATAASDLIAALDALDPGLTESAARALPGVPSGEPTIVLEALGERVPALTEDIQADVIEALEDRPRPVGYIDTGRQVTEMVRAGAITISGPVAEMRRHVSIEQTRNGWMISIDTRHEPRRTQH